MKDLKIKKPLTLENKVKFAELARWCDENGYDVEYNDPKYFYCKERVNPTYIEKRIVEYHSVGDQLDAILKSFEVVLNSGGELPVEMTEIITKWREVKTKYPKDNSL